MKRFAVIMATEKYADPAYSDTPFCHADALLLKTTLIDFCDYAEQDILIELLDPTSKITPEELINKIRQIGERSQNGDTILFFYAGHGGIFNGDTYLILSTTDSHNKIQTAVPFRDISAALRLQGRTNIRIFDTCHSGADVRGSYYTRGVEEKDNDLDVEGLVRAVARGTEEGWITIAACKEHESSYSDSTKRQGVFTWALCEAIKEIAPDNDVYPESIKVSLCKKVYEWTIDKGFEQTPTYNSAISGNVTIARRKAQSFNNKLNDNSIAEAEIDITQRLLVLRNHLRPGSDEHAKALATLISFIKSVLYEKRLGFDNYGCTLECSDPKSTYYISEELLPKLVNFIKIRNWQPLHDVEKKIVTDERPATWYERINTGNNTIKTKSTEYIVSQDVDSPPSIVQLTTQSDGIAPSATLLIYLLPLQIRVVLIAIIATSREQNYNDNTWKWKASGYIPLDLEVDNGNKIKTFINQWIDVLDSQFHESLIERVKLIESEFSIQKES